MYQELLKALYECVSDKDIPECDHEITRLSKELEELLQSEKGDDLLSKAIELAAVSEFRGFVLGFDVGRELILRKYVSK